jgi:uncharacterized protein
MGKIIIFLIIITTIYFLFIKTYKKEIKKSDKSDENEFVQCENCKTFVLKKEAIEKNGKYYCKDCNANT